MNAIDVHNQGVLEAQRNSLTLCATRTIVAGLTCGMDQHDAITLGVLSAIEKGNSITQRELARELGVALGLVNTCLRRCVRRGLVRIGQAPTRRYAYYLTPRGFVEKSRLTAEYLSASFDFFRRARREFTALFSCAIARRWPRVALAGAGELVEVAVLSAKEVDVDIIAVVDAAYAGQHIACRPVVPDLDSIVDKIDAVVVTAIVEPQKQLDATAARMALLGMAEERLLVPDLLHVRPRFAPADLIQPVGAT